MSSDDLAYLRDMRDSARLAVSYVDGLAESEFAADQKTQDAVVYRLGLIGEAAKFVSTETRERLPLEWRRITGMRDRLFHGYRDVNLSMVWGTVREDLPRMLELIEREE